MSEPNQPLVLVIEDLDLSGFGLYLTKDPSVEDSDYELTHYTSFGRPLWQRKSDVGVKRFIYDDKEITDWSKL